MIPWQVPLKVVRRHDQSNSRAVKYVIVYKTIIFPERLFHGKLVKITDSAS
jgi:hypothetical protein